MPKLNKKVAAGVAAAAIVALGAGTAYAYWTTTGSGSGSATNGSSNGTISLSATFADGLTPGASEAVTYQATNPGSSSLYVGTITPTVSTDKAGCTASDFSIAPTNANITVPAHTTVGMTVGTGSLTFLDAATNQDACKGAVVTLSLASN